MDGQGPMAPDADDPRDPSIDLPRLVGALKRRRRWILAPTLVAFVAAVLFVEMASPRYTGVAKVLLENQENYFTRPEKATIDVGANYDPEAVQSQAETVATADVARRAIDQLGLASNPEFNSSGGALGALGALLSGARADRQDQIVDAFLSRLTVFPVPRSRVLQIEFESRDPALAARAANAIAQIFLRSQEQAKADAAKSAAGWLAKRIAELRLKAADSDEKVQTFRVNAGLIAGPNGLTMPSQQLADLNTQLATARAAQSAALAKADMLRRILRAGRLDEVQDIANDDSLRRFAETRVTLKAEIAEAARTLLPEHPRMKELNGQLAGLDAQIRLAAANAARRFENDSRLAGAEVETLGATLARQSKTVAAGAPDEVQLHALELDARTTHDQLESYVQKYREATARETDSAAPPDARVIATAEPPREPTFPKKGATVLLVTLAALLISTGIAAAAALVSPEEGVVDAKALSPPAETPARPPAEAPTAPPPEAAEEPRRTDGADEVFGATEPLTKFLLEAADDGALALLVAGADSPRALAVALETARGLSAAGSAVLVDLGLTQDWLADILERGDNASAALVGLADLLEGRADYGEALRRDLSSPLDVILSGGPTHSLAGLDALIAALTLSYDHVILHASDWRSPAARAALARVMAVVVVAPASQVRGALATLREELGDDAPATIGYGAADPREAIERAA
jgi:uncharacterized protein involved in exopolysaccharide biosynthesis